MKVRLLVGRTGVDFVQNRGDEIEVDKDEATRMIDAGQAEPVKAKRETAKAKKSENARLD